MTPPTATSSKPVPPTAVPPLQAGDRLTRAEFERRYAAMPDLKKAELIEGIVYMPSPVSTDAHAAPHFNLIGWLALLWRGCCTSYKKAYKAHNMLNSSAACKRRDNHQTHQSGIRNLEE